MYRKPVAEHCNFVRGKRSRLLPILHDKLPPSLTTSSSAVKLSQADKVLRIRKHPKGSNRQAGSQ